MNSLKVLQSLSDSNLLEKTVVIFTSDHGYHMGNYGLPLDKRMPYDTGM
jgi:N-acetylglucosamine-6-sulfatase